MPDAIIRPLCATVFTFASMTFASIEVGQAQDWPDAPKASYATAGAVTSPPYGWIDFCSRQLQECNQPVLAATSANVTPQVWETMNEINRQVNATIEPVSNFDHWGTIADHWDYPYDGKGDCKIYALQKRKLLAEKGFPRQALLMTIVRDHHDQGHAILTVKTNQGDYVLDNLTEEIVPWDATGYRFVKRQSQEDPNVWVALEPPNSQTQINSPLANIPQMSKAPDRGTATHAPAPASPPR